jgi:hypothetical protein
MFVLDVAILLTQVVEGRYVFFVVAVAKGLLNYAKKVIPI